MAVAWRTIGTAFKRAAVVDRLWYSDLVGFIERGLSLSNYSAFVRGGITAAVPIVNRVGVVRGIRRTYRLRRPARCS